MINIDYIVIINFGTANTKCMCWNINNKQISPIFLGKEYKDGIYPTTTIYNGKFYSKFFDKPSNMNLIGDYPIFSNFAKELFSKITYNNKYLTYNDNENASWNYIVVISYPYMWEIQEGESLLKILQKLLPPVRYAIREDVALKELLADKEEHSIIIDLGAEKTVVYDGNFTKNLYSFSYSQIESRMLEKALIEYTSHDGDKGKNEIEILLHKNDINQVEYLLKGVKDECLTSEDSKKETIDIEKQWLFDSLHGLRDTIEDTFRKIKDDSSNYNTIIINGVYSKYIEEILLSVFSQQSKVESLGLFGICTGIIKYFKQILDQVSAFKQCLHSELLSEDDNSIIIKKTRKLACETIATCCESHGKEQLSNYVKRDDRTTYNDFTQDFYKFANVELPNYYKQEMIELLSNNYWTIIDEITKQILNPDKFYDLNIDYSCNKINNYLKYDITPFSYELSKVHLYQGIFHKVLDPCHEYTKANTEKSRKPEEREKVYNQFWNVLNNKNNSILYFIYVPKLSWVLLAEKTIIDLYALDTYCMNCKSIIASPLVPSVQTISFSAIQNVINYIFNIIIAEGSNGYYRINNSKLVYYPNSQAKNWEKFNFETYENIKKRIGNLTIELENTYYASLNIDEKLDIPYNSSKIFCIIYKLNECFELGISPDNWCRSYWSDYKIKELYKKVYTKFIVFY